MSLPINSTIILRCYARADDVEGGQAEGAAALLPARVGPRQPPAAEARHPAVLAECLLDKHNRSLATWKSAAEKDQRVDCALKHSRSHHMEDLLLLPTLLRSVAVRRFAKPCLHLFPLTPTKEKHCFFRPLLLLTI